MKYLLILLTVTAIYWGGNTIQAQSCTTAPDEDVCLYGNDFQIDSSTKSQCLIANANPFDNGLSPIGCQDKVREDGNDCIETFARWICSKQCSSCSAAPVCDKLCDDVRDDCPKAKAHGCFTGTRSSCADEGITPCDAYQVKKSALPDPINDDGGGDDDGDGSSDASGLASTASLLFITVAVIGIVVSLF